MPAADLNTNAYYVDALCHPSKTSLAATQMDLEIVILSQTEKNKYHMISLNMWNL